LVEETSRQSRWIGIRHALIQIGLSRLGLSELPTDGAELNMIFGAVLKVCDDKDVAIR